MGSFEINIQPSKVTSQYKEGEKTTVTTEQDKEKILNEALDAFFDGDIKKGMSLIQQLGIQFKISDTRISFEYNGRSYWVIAPAGGDFTDDEPLPQFKLIPHEIIDTKVPLPRRRLIDPLIPIKPEPLPDDHVLDADEPAPDVDEPAPDNFVPDVDEPAPADKPVSDNTIGYIPVLYPFEDEDNLLSYFYEGEIVGSSPEEIRKEFERRLSEEIQGPLMAYMQSLCKANGIEFDAQAFWKINDSAINGGILDRLITTDGSGNWKLTSDKIKDALLSVVNDIRTNIENYIKSEVEKNPPSQDKPAPAAANPEETTPATDENDKYKEAATTLSECAWKNSTKSRIETLAMKQSKINTRFDIEDGKIVFSKSETKTMYDDLLDTIKSELLDRRPDAYKALGGDEVLEKLFQAAWLQAYNSFKSTDNNITEDFLKAVMNNLESILKQIAQNPDVLDVLTAKPAFGNENLTKGLAHYNTNDTYGGDESVTISGNLKTDADGTVHLASTNDDKDYQETMNELFERICNEYPTVDKDSLKKIFNEASKKALNDLQNGNAELPSRKISGSSENMDSLVHLTLYYFDKELMNAVCNGSVKFLDTPRGAEAKAKTKPQERSTEQLSDIASAVPTLAEDLKSAMQSGIDSVAREYKNIHTEFGIDADGKIVFEDNNTKKAYDELRKYLENILNIKGYKGDYDKLKAACGDDIMDKLFQAAWILTYNTYSSSRSNGTQYFMVKVIDNLTNILNSLKDHPEKLDVYTSHTSYADMDLVKGLTNYNTVEDNGKEVTVDYDDAKKNTTTGIYTLQNSKDNDLYQDTMSELLARLQEKYPDIDKDVIKDLFLKAQEKAFANMGNNVEDCPYGTGNNSGRVEDIYVGKNRDWGGKNTRKGDGWDIQMDQLVQMVLYNFDKLLLAEMAK